LPTKILDQIQGLCTKSSSVWRAQTRTYLFK